MLKRLLFVFLLAAVATLAFADGEYQPVVGYTDLAFAINGTGDTTMVMKYTPTAFDSFLYRDSFSYQPDTTAHQTIDWRSPVQTMIITPTVDVATTYACSVAFTNDTLGISKDYSAGVATLAALIDTLVDMINLKVNLTDSVTAEDSVTYIKLVSNFSQDKFTERWTMRLGVSGGAGTLDSAAHASQATVLMICDTMVALINADAGLDSFMTALVDQSQTFYSVTADFPGALFFGAVFGGTSATPTVDSLQDTLTTQTNTTVSSSQTDTTSLENVRGFDHLDGRIILRNSFSGYAGQGNDDSAIVTLYSVGPDARVIIGVDTCASPPCTLDVMLHSNVGDTALRRQIEIGTYIRDTVSDTSLTIYYRMLWDLNLK